MTDPGRPSGAVMLVKGKHGRTVTGIALMVVGVAAFAYVLVHGGARAPGQSMTWVEVAHEYGFPALLLIGGYRLFDKEAFGDLWDKAKSLLPGSKQP